VWQQQFEKYQNDGFTVVGIALDVEGVPPAKLYYEKFGVTFPALVDPNYATGFGVVPKTFFVDEHGVVQELSGWEDRLKPASERKPVTDAIASQWTDAEQRLAPASIARLVAKHTAAPEDLETAVELASRYIELQLTSEAKAVLLATTSHYEPRTIAQSDDRRKTFLLGHAYLQLSRASVGDRATQVEYATLSYYLNPSIGFGKQIARIIAPDKFDNRPNGDFDNRFREATLKRLRRERAIWLASK